MVGSWFRAEGFRGYDFVDHLIRVALATVSSGRRALLGGRLVVSMDRGTPLQTTKSDLLSSLLWGPS